MRNSLRVMLLVGWAISPAIGWEHDAERICTEERGIPFAIVKGIVQVESNGAPYVLNVAIGSVWRAYRFDDVTMATMFLAEALKHTDRIDIGLMQVHWAIWKQHYDLSAYELLEMTTNLRVGCDILANALSEDGPLWQRIGRYHSQTPERNERYALAVLEAALDR